MTNPSMRRDALRPRILFRVIGFASLGVSGVLTAVPASAVGSQSDEASQARDHVVFVGMNLFVSDATGEGRVQEVSKREVEVLDSGYVKTVPRKKIRSYNITRVPRVSDVSLTVDRLTSTRTYTPASDPGVAALRNKILLDSLRAEQEDAYTQAVTQQMNAAGRLAQSEQEGGSSPMAAAVIAANRAALNRATARVSEASNDLNMVNSDPTFSMAQGDREAARELYDALETTFVVSSPQPIDDAYAVVVSTIRIGSEESGFSEVNSIEMAELPKITSRRRKIKIEQQGLPVGYELVGSEVHIYSRNRELATNLSERRVEVSQSDAFQFLLAQHRLRHRHDDLPPQIVPELRPRDLDAEVPEDQMGRNAQVEVDSEGRVKNVLLYPAGLESIDRYVESVIRQTRFLPALLDGEPADGHVTLTVGSFLR